jgi:hypothetical protein
VLAFVPQEGGEPVWRFELKMVVGTLFFLGLGLFFFFVNGRRPHLIGRVAAPAPEQP